VNFVLQLLVDIVMFGTPGNKCSKILLLQTYLNTKIYPLVCSSVTKEKLAKQRQKTEQGRVHFEHKAFSSFCSELLV